MQLGKRETTTTDVTGGIIQKINELVSAVKVGIQVLIVDASKEEDIYRALRGQKVIGTLIE
jgi:isopentenyl phosphate kinase